jgi:hypothetical protein
MASRRQRKSTTVRHCLSIRHFIFCNKRIVTDAQLKASQAKGLSLNDEDIKEYNSLSVVFLTVEGRNSDGAEQEIASESEGRERAPATGHSQPGSKNKARRGGRIERQARTGNVQTR